MKSSLCLPLGLLFLYLAFSLFSSCSKKAEEPKVAPVVTSLSTLKGQYAPYELVTIKAPKGTLGTQELEGIINGIKVQVLPGDTLACFLLPDLANGSFILSLAANGKDYTVPVAVVALASVQSPDVYFGAIEAGINRNVAAINAQIDALLQSGATAAELQNLKLDAQQYAAQLASYKTAYQNLSAADKQDFARMMAANKPLMDEFGTLTAALLSKTSTLRTAQTVQDYEQSWFASARAFGTAAALTWANVWAIGILGKALTAAPGVYKVGVLVAIGAFVAGLMLNVEATAAAAGVLFDKAIKAYDELDVDKKVYDIKTDIEVSVTAKYRSLFQGDETSGAGGSALDDVLAKYKRFKESFNDLVNKLPAPLRPRQMVSLLREKFRSVGRSIHNSYVRITNVSNPAVTLTPVKQPDGSLKVRATTTATTDQSFTYNLAYSNPDFSPGLTKQVAATVIVNPCSSGTVTAPVITGIQTVCDNGKVRTLVSFTADGPGILIGGSYFGSCVETNQCYPVRLYFFSPGATAFSIAANGYSAQLLSGTVNQGVLAVDLSSYNNCITGRTARQTMDYYYPNYQWQIELMNSCNLRSPRMAF